MPTGPHKKSTGPLDRSSRGMSGSGPSPIPGVPASGKHNPRPIRSELWHPFDLGRCSKDGPTEEAG